MKTTIEWLEKQTSIADFKLISGVNGRDNIISGVNIMDNPDTIRFLVGGELILSTGYFLKEDEDLKHHFIRDLHQRKCAGLVIALNRYLDEIPKDMIDDSNELGMPILIVSYEINFSQISRLVYSGILQSEMSDADRLYKMYHEFNISLVREHTLNDVLNNIERVIGFPLILTNERFELIRKSQNASSITAVDSQYPFESDICLDFVKTYEKNHFEVMTRYDKIIFSLNDDSQLLGFVCFLNTSNGFNSILYNFIYSILPLICIETINEKIRQNASRHGRSNFLKNMLSGNLSKSEIELQCEIYNFSPNLHRVCIVLQPDFNIDATINDKRIILEQYYNVVKHISTTGQNAIYQYIDDNNVVILLLFQTVTINAMHNYIDKYIVRLCEQFDRIEFSYHIGISEILNGITTLSTSYTEAFNALSLGRKLHSAEKVYKYADNPIYHLVNEIQPDSFLIQGSIEQLKPIIDFDEAHNTNLLTTLYIYLKNDCSVKDSSTELYIHRNTMASRLEKIMSLLPNFDFNNFEDKAKIYIAFHIYTLKYKM